MNNITLIGGFVAALVAIFLITAYGKARYNQGVFDAKLEQSENNARTSQELNRVQDLRPDAGIVIDRLRAASF